MFSFTINRPATFFTKAPDLMILDEHQNPFYWHDNKEHHITFNLPPGKYYSNATIVNQRRFLPYKNKPLQPGLSDTYPRFSGTFLLEVQVHPHPNPNKASISLETRQIYADPKFFYHEYKPLKMFTLLHEVFHNFYHAKNERERNNPRIREFIEMQCDNAARNYMLANGWNPTQVSLAVKLLLRGKARKECIRLNTTDKRNNFRR